MQRLLPYCLVLLTMLATLDACAGPPKTFLKGQASQWVVVEVRDDVDGVRAWNSVFDLLCNEFDFAMVLKDDGYMRTDWLYSYGGKYDFEYRLRVTVRFAPDRRSLRVKAEAQYRDGDNWILGVDSRLLTTLKTDLMGTIGRTTR